MSDEKAQQEPSMEDILASIRRILSEEEAEEKSAPVEPAAEVEAPAPMREPEPEPEPEPVAMPQDDIDSMFASPAPAPEPEPEPEDDILELTEDMVFGEPEPVPEPEPAFDASEFDPEPVYTPEPIVSAASRIASEIDNDMRYRSDDDGGEPLLSSRTENRSTSLLSDLAREIVRQRSIGIGNGIITLEDMVREILRPVLKEWLDENLPYMIERIVKKEIEKMVNRAENL